MELHQHRTQESHVQIRIGQGSPTHFQVETTMTYMPLSHSAPIWTLRLMYSCHPGNSLHWHPGESLHLPWVVYPGLFFFFLVPHVFFFLHLFILVEHIIPQPSKRLFLGDKCLESENVLPWHLIVWLNIKFVMPFQFGKLMYLSQCWDMFLSHLVDSFLRSHYFFYSDFGIPPLVIFLILFFSSFSLFCLVFVVVCFLVYFLG